MKKYLLGKEGDFYKTNLHCHSTISDGSLNVTEIKELYKSMGYSAVAFTDHDVLIPHNDLTDESFVALNGFEVEINSSTSINYSCCHICAVALKNNNITQPCFNGDYLFGNAPQWADCVQFDETEPPFVREYTPENISLMMRTFRDKGFFVTYNHPTWSNENYNHYTKYDGMHAMEMVNYGCVAFGFEDYNPRVYDDMLQSGKKIFAIATDDNHNRYEKGHPLCDAGGGFTMINAPALSYENLTNALLCGKFYASEGPEIYALYLEDDCVTIKTSNAKSIFLTAPNIYSQVVTAKEGEYVNSATFKILPDKRPAKEFYYFRLTVLDENGKHATTNAYFLEDIFTE